MELHERTQERTNRDFHNDRRVVANGGVSNSDGHGGLSFNESGSDGNLAHKKGLREQSLVYTFVWTLLFVIVLIVENICHFKLFENCQTAVVFYWLESCVTALFFKFWGSYKQISSFRNQTSHFLPLQFLHVAVVTVYGLDFNNSAFGLSAGSESYLISLALTPPILLLASWLTNKQNYPGKVILTVAMSSSLLMVLFCSFEDEYAHYKMLFHHGLLGLIMSGSLAFFIVYAKRYLAKASCVELLYVLNLGCVVFLPFIALLLGELHLLEAELSKQGKLKLILSILIVAVVRLASQAVCLYHLKYSTPLLNGTARGFSWIWTTVAITFITPGVIAELVVPVLASFWISGPTFVLTLLFEFHWI